MRNLANVGTIPGAGPAARGGAGQNQGYVSEGFTGISSGASSAVGGVGGMGIGGGGMMGRDRGNRGGGGNRGGAAQAPVAREVTEPNGLSIQGYTETPAAFKEFVDNLKASNEFVEVYYSEADLVEVPESELWQAPTAGVSTAGPMGGGARSSGSRGRNRDDDDGGGFGFGRSAAPQPLYGPAGAVDAGGKRVLRFRLDVQFQGDVVPQPTMSITSSGRPSVGIGGGGGGGSRRRDRDEDD
jgi:hypothetical protein